VQLTGDWSKLQSEELYNVCTSDSFLHVNGMRCAGTVACMLQEKCVPISVVRTRRKVTRLGVNDRAMF
jgi:hypothetical protein